MSSRALRKTVLCMALGLSLSSIVLLPSAYAANTDGSVTGQSVPGAEVTVRDPQTGFSRSVTADAQGNYRFPFLPIGTYTLQASKDGTPVGEPTTVTVGLGTTTNMAAVQVVGSRVITPIDVSSTESATNITKEELDRLPVAQSAQSVALLAPGVVDGSYGGISFGGSSVSENTVYINGLNVTDFYRRVGFSSVPFAFFDEFQIKTGGYSVEFGRTTGGVINAVTKSGTSDFKFGTQLVWEPEFLQTSGTDRYNASGKKIISLSHDEYDRRNLNRIHEFPDANCSTWQNNHVNLAVHPCSGRLRILAFRANHLPGEHTGTSRDDRHADTGTGYRAGHPLRK